MKFIATFALAVGLASASLPRPAFALSPADVYAKVAPSVWRVQTYDEDGLPLALGSAVVVAPDMLVTNCHVLARARRVVVKHDKETIAAKLALWDPARDVCEMRTTGLKAPAVTIGDDAELRVGQAAYALGNPRGLDLTMSEGLVSSIRRNDKEQIVLLQTSASISMGSSGGGLFDDQARLIGLTTLVVNGLKPGDTQNLNFAVPVEWVQQLPQRHARSMAAASAASSASSATAGKPPSNEESVIAHLIANAPQSGGGGASVGSVAPPLLYDDEHLPFTNEKMREAYRRFLTRTPPRAFVIGENGSWFSTANDAEAKSRGGISDVAQRAVLGCQRRAPTRCLVYAIDDHVVYDASKR